MTHVYKLALKLIWKEKISQDLGGNQTHDQHNSCVTALPFSYQALRSKVVGS